MNREVSCSKTTATCVRHSASHSNSHAERFQMLHVREMTLAEADAITEYFHSATPEYLDTLGVDPTGLPGPDQWRERFAREYCRPIDHRGIVLATWESDGVAIGFATADKIACGKEAHMHLHILRAEQRRIGYGVTCVQLTAKLLFDRLDLKRLFCEPNAFNVAPNRTLQRAGFKYVKTYETVPGPLN